MHELISNKVNALIVREKNADNMKTIDKKAIHHVKMNDKNNTVFCFKEKPSQEAIDRSRLCLEQETYNGMYRITTNSKKNNPYHNNEEYIPMYQFISIKGRDYIEKNNLILYTYGRKKYLKRTDLL
jgi:hypothetical protein